MIRKAIEEAKARRAWNGKLKNIDDLLWWMYDKGILTKTEQKKKDTVFRQYYRYYNDGDFPRALASKGVSSYSSKDVIENALEEYLEDFIKSILMKYSGKIDRKEFRIDKFIKDTKQVLSTVEENDVYGLINYWKKNINDSKILEKVQNLVPEFEKINKLIEEQTDKKSRYALSYVINQLKDKNELTPEIEKIWKDLKIQMVDIAYDLKNLINASEKLKKLRAIK